MDLEKLAYAGLGAALTFIYFAFGRSQAPEKAQAKNEHIPGAFDDQPSAGQKKSKKKAKGGQKQTDESVVKGTVVESGQGKAALDAEVTKPAGMPPIPNEGQGNASKAKKPTKTDTEKTKKGELVALSATKESKETTTADASAPKPAASTKKAEPSAPKPDTKGKSVAQQPTASYANAASITSTTDSQKNDRKIVLEPKPEKGAKWLDTDQPEVLTAHRVMKIVEPKPVEKPRLPEAEGWTTVKAKSHAPKPASSGPKPSQPVVSVPVRHEEDDEELTKTQRKNKKKAEQQKAMKEALAREQEERLRQHRVEQRAAGINMRYIPPPSAPPQSMWKKPAGAAPTSPTGPAKPPITDDFSEIWD